MYRKIEIIGVPKCVTIRAIAMTRRTCIGTTIVRAIASRTTSDPMDIAPITGPAVGACRWLTALLATLCTTTTRMDCVGLLMDITGSASIPTLSLRP